MPSFKKYKTFERPVPITLANGDTLTLRYSPVKYSAAFNERSSKRVQQATEEGKTPEAGMSNDAFLAEILTGWDWTDDSGKEMKITAECLRTEVYLKDQAAMVDALFADMFPNATTVTSNNSASVSPDTAEDSGLS